MIRAWLLSRDGLLVGFDVQGHAGYARSGSDIVCAAVSALTITCANSLESVCGLQPDVKSDGSGDLHLRLPEGLGPAQTHDAQILLGALRQGFEDLAGQYPRHFQFSISNGGKHHDET